MRTEALLTPHMIAALAPKQKDYAVFDAQCPTLAIRVQPSGAKSWVTWQRTNGKSRRITMALVAKLAHQDAQKAALSYNATKERPAIPKRVTFAELVKRFLKSKAGVYRPQTLFCMSSYLNTQLLPAFGKHPVDKITTPDVAAWFHGYSRDKPGGANQALLHFTTILNWAKEAGHIPHDMPNPASPLRKNRRAARGRMLNSEDLHRLFTTLTSPPPRTREAAKAIELVLLTGCHSGEILRLSWKEVKADRLNLSRTKTGARSVMLSSLAIARLAALRETRSTAYVFPSPRNPNQPRTSLTCAWRTIKKAAGLPATLRLHDLRHTYASHALLSGESLYTTGQLIGHRNAQSTQRYAHLAGDELQRAANNIANHIEKLMGGHA